ncbi:hypothetical protein FLL45_05385 [Aliikangiella marina]|uniref:Uncharacterized protein n=1 Tax=Aliikangiella marina TaxID=1712262 RepID=A0A545TJJ0_9GAMM|nr:hypothetical protein [Aliikangiella marina]TQV77378.1 hypothetical protein FLL45_05385 [Aliikangiella marina]
MRILFFLAILLFISGCAESVSLANIAEFKPVGFWYGLWHGIILPVAWITSLFSENTAIYAVYNNGAWYDTGFILGIGVSIALKTGADGIFRRFMKKKAES